MKWQLASVCVLTLTVATVAAVGGDFDLAWHTIDGGGGTSTGGAFEISGTIGQHDAGEPVTGGLFELACGFWPGGVTPLPDCPADIAPPSNGDGLVNADDLLAVIENWGPCPIPPATCPQNIITTGISANQIDVNDMLATLINWGACP